MCSWKKNTMPPARRDRRVGLKRIDAALDAVRPMGFPEPLVRRTVRNLLKLCERVKFFTSLDDCGLQEYGGDEGWAFIEECCYKLLIDTLLDEVEKSERENCEPGLLTGNDKLKHLIENGPAEDDTVKDEPKVQVHSPNGNSKQVHSPNIHSPASMDIILCPSVSDAPDEKLGVKDFSQQIHSAQASSSHFNSSHIPDIVPSTLKDVSSLVKLEIQSCSPQISSTGVQSPHLFSPSPVDSLPRQRRKPCYGWLSSDDEDEPDLLHLTPAT
ncbi:uncharacterized protein LOC133696377 isoform X1 [Populus nigra]|uniref:uncharacterized protein LOC133696377 isoform X1 n=1 Tax=Populus nigra TaxID=3691 RepID=UPI002B27692C|nr:uncharacterized protein LOC133696377 isoform X1 [Populus nigra]